MSMATKTWIPTWPQVGEKGSCPCCFWLVISPTISLNEIRNVCVYACVRPPQDNRGITATRTAVGFEGGGGGGEESLLKRILII